MVFTIVNSIEYTFRKYKNMKMAIWHIATHFVVEGHLLGRLFCILRALFSDTVLLLLLLMLLLFALFCPSFRNIHL